MLKKQEGTGVEVWKCVGKPVDKNKATKMEASRTTCVSVRKQDCSLEVESEFAMMVYVLKSELGMQGLVILVQFGAIEMVSSVLGTHSLRPNLVTGDAWSEI